jgi:hypothetical protein
MGVRLSLLSLLGYQVFGFLLRFGNRRRRRKNYMKNTAKTNRPSADEIAKMAMKGEDVSRFLQIKAK